MSTPLRQPALVLLVACLAWQASLPAAGAEAPAPSPTPRVAIPTTAAEVRPLGNYPSLASMRERLLDRQRAGEDVSRALGAVRQVLDALAATRRALDAGALAMATKLSSQVQALAREAYWMSYPSRDGELRGVWATNSVTPDWATAMATLRQANLNAVFPYMCTAGVAWYDSDFLPHATPTDYLQRACAAGRAAGIAVHARTLGLFAMCVPPEFRETLKAQGRLMVSGAGKSTNWLCPVNPRNRRLLAQVVREIAANYPVDGIQLDYMRYPGESYCFCPACKAAFQQSLGQPLTDMAARVKSGPLRQTFLEWRRAQLTSLVHELRAQVREARPAIPFSAAVFLNWEDHRDCFAQDWKTWVDRGLVDFVCPMDYTPRNDRFATYVQRQIGWVAGRVPLCPGLGVNADGMEYGGPQTLLDQITIARNLATDGWVVFNYSGNFVRGYLPALALGATSSAASFNPFRHALMPPGGG